MSGSPDLVIKAFGSLAAAEARLAELRHCGCCEQLFHHETVWRRAYAIPGGALVLTVLCASCNAQLAAGSEADSRFQRALAVQVREIAAAGSEFRFVRATTAGRAFHINRGGPVSYV